MNMDKHILKFVHLLINKSSHLRHTMNSLTWKANIENELTFADHLVTNHRPKMRLELIYMAQIKSATSVAVIFVLVTCTIAIAVDIGN